MKAAKEIGKNCGVHVLPSYRTSQVPRYFDGSQQGGSRGEGWTDVEQWYGPEAEKSWQVTNSRQQATVLTWKPLGMGKQKETHRDVPE